MGKRKRTDPDLALLEEALRELIAEYVSRDQESQSKRILSLADTKELLRDKKPIDPSDRDLSGLTPLLKRWDMLRQQYHEFSKGELSAERILLELHREMGDTVSQLERRPAEELDRFIDAILRRRRVEHPPRKWRKVDIARSIEDEAGASPDPSWISNWCKRATFPKPVDKDGRSDLYDADSVLAWIEANTRYRRKKKSS